nr:PD-(D/E)XK nuclease family transposase [Flammeovirga aprica]
MCTSRYINPFTDFGFKKIFGEESSKEILIDFLNSVLPAKDHIYDLTYKQTEHLPKNDTDRKAIYDLYCEMNEEKGLLWSYSVPLRPFLRTEQFITQIFLFRSKLKRVCL